MTFGTGSARALVTGLGSLCETTFLALTFAATGVKVSIITSTDRHSPDIHRTSRVFTRLSKRKDCESRMGNGFRSVKQSVTRQERPGNWAKDKDRLNSFRMQPEQRDPFPPVFQRFTASRTPF